METTPNLLIQNAKPVGSNHDGNDTVDIRIKDGVIAEIGSGLDQQDGEEVFDAAGAYISGGWMDMHVHFREPGYEHKETVETGCRSAMFGGFTEVACMPNTKPAIHTRDVVEFIRNKSEKQLVDVHPIGCVTKERKGESIAEMSDMKEGGAVAFSDDGDPVYNSQVMRVALEYSSMLGVPICCDPWKLTSFQPRSSERMKTMWGGVAAAAADAREPSKMGNSIGNSVRHRGQPASRQRGASATLSVRALRCLLYRVL